MKKFFQSNISCQLVYANTEFSSPGASSKFLDEYSIDEENSLLGTGGYAEVRKGKHKKTGHPVALKIYDKYKLIDVQIKQNIIREIKILTKLKDATNPHPNILRLYESIDSLSNVYLITEYAEGIPF